MYGKICPYCQGKSFSAIKDPWQCPYCGKDISHIEVVLAVQIADDNHLKAGKDNDKN